jgi:hypothetical protein
MDTSSSIVATNRRITPREYLLDRSTITTTEVPASEWVSIIRGILEKCKPQLKYFDGFKPIKDLFPAFHTSIVLWHQQTMRFMFPEHMDRMDWDTKICHLSISGDCTFSGWVNEFPLPSGAIVNGQNDLWRLGLTGGQVFVRQSLYMSNKGDLLVASFFHYAAGDEDSLVDLSVASDKVLQEMILRSHGTIIDILTSLRKMLSEGNERRARQLADHRTLLDYLENVSTHINVLVHCQRCGGSKERWRDCPHCEIQGTFSFMKK